MWSFYPIYVYYLRPGTMSRAFGLRFESMGLNGKGEGQGNPFLLLSRPRQHSGDARLRGTDRPLPGVIVRV